MDTLARYNAIQRQRYFENLRALLQNPSCLTSPASQAEEAGQVFDWKKEHQSVQWKEWWRGKLKSVFLLLLWHFVCVFAFTTVVYFWKEASDTLNTMISLLCLFARIIFCVLGRKIHTGKYLTRLLIFFDGFLTAYIYNCTVRFVWLPYNVLIFLPSLIAFCVLTIYALVLHVVGIRLTTDRFNGLKFIPIELCAATIVLLQLPYFLLQYTGSVDLPYVEYMAHILLGELIGFIICTAMACYLLSKLNTAIARKTVKDALSLYALGSPSEPSQPMELV